MGLVLMFWNLWHGRKHGRVVGKNPWGAATLEWTLPSPPPTHNFDEDPIVTHGPYHYDGLIPEEDAVNESEGDK